MSEITSSYITPPATTGYAVPESTQEQKPIGKNCLRTLSPNVASAPQCKQSTNLSYTELFQEFTRLLTEMFASFMSCFQSLLQSLNSEAEPPANSESAPLPAKPPKSNKRRRKEPGVISSGKHGPELRARKSNLEGGFLWKPISDSDRRLAVLLPENVSGKVRTVRILSPDGESLLATGRFTGIGNGDREHYRFSKPGSSFPNGAIVEVLMQDGSTRRVLIEKTALRVVS